MSGEREVNWEAEAAELNAPLVPESANFYDDEEYEPESDGEGCPDCGMTPDADGTCACDGFDPGEMAPDEYAAWRGRQMERINAGDLCPVCESDPTGCGCAEHYGPTWQQGGPQ